MTFQPMGGNAIGGGGSGSGVDMVTVTDGTEMNIRVRVTHDKDLPSVHVFSSGGEDANVGTAAGTNVGSGHVGHNEGMSVGTEMGMSVGMDVGIGATRLDNDDDSQLDPRILMESAVSGGWGAVER